MSNQQSLPEKLKELCVSSFFDFKDAWLLLIGGFVCLGLLPFPFIIVMVISLIGAGLGSAVLQMNGTGLPPAMMVVLPLIAVMFVGAVLATVYASLGMARLSNCLARGRRMSFGEIFKCADLYLGFLGAMIICLLMVGIGMFFFVLPGIYIAIRCVFVTFLCADGKAPIEAIKESFALSSGREVEIFLIGGAFVLSSIILGFLPLVNMVSSFVLAPYMNLTLAKLYISVISDNPVAESAAA